MAGIGFELRKLVETRTIRGVLGAAFSGTLVVAGPWLLTAASLAAAQALPFLSSPGVALAFTGAMVWALAISICASAAPLYVFVRLSADLIYDGDRGEAVTLLLKYAAASAALSVPIGLGASLFLVDGSYGARPGDATLLRLAFTLLLASVNSLWASMMTATVIRKYGRILAAYALGMGLMYVLARALGPSLGAAGALLALASGYALTGILLIAATVEALGRRPYPGAFRKLAAYAAKYRNLALAGALYAVATWIDKVVLAAFGGLAAKGTLFLVNPGYDGAFYYSNLALIPGLVFFTIVTETEFNLDLKRLVAHLAHRRQPEIESAKTRLIRGAAVTLASQSAFQGAVAIGVLLVAPYLAAQVGAPEAIFARLLAGGFFQLILLSALNMLFYLELYRDAAYSALAFALINLGLSLAACLSGHAAALQGLPYLAACLVAAALSLVLLFRGLRRFDRVVFLRASGEEYGR
jgi:polysaccharide biosynthesis protein PelG